jgi:hypothetical protein
MQTVLTLRRAFLVLTGNVAAGLPPTPSAGQGGEPIRFTVPVNLGAVGQAYKPSGWELTLAYRRLYSNQYFVDPPCPPRKLWLVIQLGRVRRRCWWV